MVYSSRKFSAIFFFLSINPVHTCSQTLNQKQKNTNCSRSLENSSTRIKLSYVSARFARLGLTISKIATARFSRHLGKAPAASSATRGLACLAACRILQHTQFISHSIVLRAEVLQAAILSFFTLFTHGPTDRPTDSDVVTKVAFQLKLTPIANILKLSKDLS